jgi:uncharacterized protein DUF2569
MPFAGIPVTWLILWVICYNRRLEEIGGWLLFYYIQLYMGIGISLLLLPLSIGALLPSRWAGAPGRYALVLLGTVPLYAIFLMQAFVAHRLRRSREAAYLVRLRRTLWACLVIVALRIAIDLEFFSLDLFLDGWTLLWTAIWLPYFYRSIRVGHVFVTKDWGRVAALVVD